MLAKVRGKYIAFMEGFWAVGYVLSGAISFFVLPYLGWRWVFVVVGSLSLVVLLVRRGMPESPQRVVKVAAAPGQPFGMRELAAQIARLQEADGPADDHVGQAFEALTTAGSECSCIVLIVDGAEALLPETLRFIQLACEMQPRLQVLLAAQPEFEDCLEDREFAVLRGRLAPTLVLGGLSENEAAAFVVHRLRAAGLAGKAPVADNTLKMLVSYGMGNPGRIGAVLDRALAAKQRQAPDLISVVQHGQRARAEAGALRAGSTHVVQRSRPDERVAQSASTSPGHRRSYRRAWAVAMLGLTGGVGLAVAIAASGARVQRDQITAVSAGSVTASSAGGPADVAQASPAATSPTNPTHPEAGPVSTLPDDPAVSTRPEARATVFVTAPARVGLPPDTTAGDGASYPGGTRPVTPSSNPTSGARAPGGCI